MTNAKMATEIPAAITMPGSVETRLGTLRFTDGFPDAATVEKVFDNLDFQHAVQAFLTTSLVLYDTQTRSMLQTDQPFPSIGSQKKGVAINPDTSVDIYFGPTAPSGKESNWVQMWPGKGWTVILRLYGPLQPFFDKTWRPSEIEEVK